MKKLMMLAVVAGLLLVPGDVLSQRGGGRGGGGGGARPAARPSAPSPSFNRPSAPAARPSVPSPSPRPSPVPQPRPNPTPQPSRPITPDRPSINPITPNRPDTRPVEPSRPIYPNRPDNRPVEPVRPINPDRPPIRPVDPVRPDRPDRPIEPVRPIRPADRPVRPPDRPLNINNRPIDINNVRPGCRPWWDYHYHPWHHGYWGWWRPVGWFAGGAAVGWLLSPAETNYVYSNPYYDQSTTVYDYSQPLPPPPETVPTDAQSTKTTEDAESLFDQARDAFKKGDYKKALDLDDQAIKQLPVDATLHEFRALCLFALKDYKQAASTIYAVMAAGPGWDWETMKVLYPDTSTYTEQLRALETFQKANPKSADASFLLAYHYSVLGYPDSAIKQLENVTKLQPDNQLAAQLLKSLKQEVSKPAPTPTPGQ